MSTVIRGATLQALVKHVTETGSQPHGYDRARRQLSKLKHGEQLMGIRRSEARAMLAWAKAIDEVLVKANLESGMNYPIPPIPVEAKRLLDTLEIVEGDE